MSSLIGTNSAANHYVPSSTQDVSDAEMDDDEAALAAAEAWEPDPVTADPLRSSRTRRMSDVIAALVGIYGSNELFITEYRSAPVAAGSPPRPWPSGAHCLTGLRNDCNAQTQRHTLTRWAAL